MAGNAPNTIFGKIFRHRHMNVRIIKSVHHMIMILPRDSEQASSNQRQENHQIYEEGPTSLQDRTHPVLAVLGVWKIKHPRVDTSIPNLFKSLFGIIVFSQNIKRFVAA